MLTSLSVDEILLSRYMNLSSYFRGLTLRIEMDPSLFKHTHYNFFAFTLKPMSLAASTKLRSSDSAWEGVVARSAR